MSSAAPVTLVLCRPAFAGSPPDAALAAAQRDYLNALGDVLVGESEMRLRGADGAVQILAFAASPAIALAHAEASPFRTSGHWQMCEVRAVPEAADPAAAFAEATVPTLRMVPMPADLNPGGGVFGGWLLAQMDQAAGIVAWRHTGGRCASVALRMTFNAPLVVGDDVRFHAEIRSQGRTSMRIGVDAWARARPAETVRLVGRALFTYVALDGEGKPRAIAP